MKRAHSRKWLILATALMTLSALLLPLSTGAFANTDDNTLDLDVDPEEQVAAVGQQHTITAKLARPCPDTIACHIDALIEDADADFHNPDGGCTIGSTLTTCNFTINSSTVMTALVRIWVDDDQTDNSFDADQTEPRAVKTTPGGRAEPDDTDVIQVKWAEPGVVTRVDASPEIKTTSITKQHTVTCRLLDGLGFGVGGETCDADISKGPNKNNNVDGDPATRPGYLGECTTGPEGYCSWTYDSNEFGTDTVRVFYDKNNDDLKFDEPQDAVTRTWTADITSGPCAGLNFGQTASLPGGGKKFAGTPNADKKTGTPFRDIFCGLGGADRFDGVGGDDTAIGGPGNDTLLGRKGSDGLQGSDGVDNLLGAEGTDKIFSGKGNDATSGGPGNDKVFGDAGIDLVLGLAGNDTLAGGDGADKVKGGSGNDGLSGGAGNDALNGGAGDDNCNGGPGSNTLTSC